MISTSNWVRLHLIGSEGQCATITRERGERWLNEYVRTGWRRERWQLVEVAHCHVCGKPATVAGQGIRCDRHAARNPCAIEGCTRSRAAPASGRLADDAVLCAEHWRRYVPPGSRARRAYNAFWRQGKRYGWGYKGKRGKSARLDYRLNRFFNALVRQARHRAEGGHIDEAAISALFGWDQPGG